MNKYKLFLALCLIPQLLVAQELNIKSLPSVENNYLKEGNKEIKYSISIKKENKVFFQSNFYIKNENSVVIYNQEKIMDKKQINNKNATSGLEPIILNQEIQDIQETQLNKMSMIIHIYKNGKNMSSDFFYNSLDVGKQEKVAVLSQEDSKAVATETSPLLKKEDKKISILHLKNEETVFVWEDKEFTIKAKY